MFSNLPIDVLFWLIVCVFLIGLYFWSIHNKFKIYNKSEEVAGSILMELEPSKKTQLYRRIELIVSILLVIIFSLQGIFNTGNLIIFIGVVGMVSLSNRNQKICENGILCYSGLVTWDNIQSIDDVCETDHKIKLRLKKSLAGVKKVTLYCTEAEILNALHWIERKMAEAEFGINVL